MRVFDPTDPSLPIGKQVGWYTPTSGIWQTVWLKRRPASYIETLPSRLRSPEPAARPDGLAHLRMASLSTGKYTTFRPENPGAMLRRPRFEISRRSPSIAQVRCPRRARALDARKPSPPSDLTLVAEEAGEVDRQDEDLFWPADDRPREIRRRSISRGSCSTAIPFPSTALDQSFNPKGIYTAPDDAF